MSRWLSRAVRLAERATRVVRYRSVRGPAGAFRVPRFAGLEPLLYRHEPWLDALLRAAFADSSGHLIDVGANVGQYLVKLLRVRPEAGYLGFEPNPECAAVVARIIAANRLSRHSVLPVALSRESGCARLHLRRAIDESASMVEGFRPASFYARSQPIVTCAGDDVLEALGIEDIALIKVDVEGGELDVLEGLRRTLERRRPPVVFEVLPNFLFIGRRELSAQEIAFRSERLAGLEALLRGCGYALAQVREGARLHLVDKIDPSAIRTQDETSFLAVEPRGLEAFERAEAR